MSAGKGKPAAELVPVGADNAVDSQMGNVAHLEITGEHIAYAAGLGIDLGGSLDECLSRAVEHANCTQRHMLAMGLLFATIRAQCEHGQFVQLVEGRGFERRTATRSMQYAQFIMSRPEADRLRLIELPYTKVLPLAGSEPEVIEELLQARGDQSIEELSVRTLCALARELRAKAGNLRAELEMSQGAVEALSAKLLRLEQGVRDDNVPPLVSGLRAELLVLQKKAELAIEGVRAVGIDLVGLAGNQVASPWADGTLRLAVAGLAGIHLQLQGVLKQYLHAAPEIEAPLPPMAYLSTQELVELQMRFTTVAGAEALEKAQRNVERLNEQNKGKRGRPLKMPGTLKGGAQ